VPGAPERLLAVLRVARLEVSRILRGRGMLGRVVLVALPVLLCGAGALSVTLMASNAFEDPLLLRGSRRVAADVLPELAQLFRFFVLPFVTFILCAELSGNLFRAELADRTLHHVFLSPVRRELVVVGKFLAAVVVMAAALEISWLLSTGIALLPHGPGAALGALLSGEGLRHVLRHGLVLVLAPAAYGALFLLLGLAVKKPLHLGFLFFLWEWATLFLPQAFKRASIVHWLESLLPLRLRAESHFARVAEPEPAWLAVLVLLAIAAGLVAASTLWARRMQLSYGEAE
jgi:ABC-type transport system involved in multi-copper enzyme maturation permease subunit